MHTQTLPIWFPTKCMRFDRIWRSYSLLCLPIVNEMKYSQRTNLNLIMTSPREGHSWIILSDNQHSGCCKTLYISMEISTGIRLCARRISLLFFTANALLQTLASDRFDDSADLRIEIRISPYVYYILIHQKQPKPKTETHFLLVNTLLGLKLNGANTHKNTLLNIDQHGWSRSLYLVRWFYIRCRHKRPKTQLIFLAPAGCESLLSRTCSY